MDWNNLKKIKEAPEAGQMLAYTRQNVLFEPYQNMKEVKCKLDGKELLELHLFDNQKEYRAISSVSRRFCTGGQETDYAVEAIADFPELPETVYKETVCLQGGGKLHILNHISYMEAESQEKEPRETTQKILKKLLMRQAVQETEEADTCLQESGMAFVDNYRLQMETERS